MATVDPKAAVGGGVTTGKQEFVPLKITSDALLNELKDVYKHVAHRGLHGTHLRPSDFQKFLQETQHEVPTSGHAFDLLAKNEEISFEDFKDYFCGPNSNAVEPAKAEDLSQPLTSYFISSSHNTYLVGHQLYGSSTAQGYINVLRRACRCIEIDVWDGDDGEPEVVHGWTLTKEISFKDVCIAIGENAFLSSDLPLIVSLECHAGMEQQEKIVKIIKTVWKDMLLEGGLDGWDVAEKGLPPPGLLKKKILVKVKYLPPEAQPGGPTQNIGIQSLSDQTKKLSVNQNEEESSSEDDFLSSRSGSDGKGKKKPPKVKISPALSALGVYASAMKFANSFSDAVSTRPNHVFSFSESKFNSLHEAQADALFQHNRHFLTRVYPFGLRVSSGNLNPQDFWHRGAQLVALNWQKLDKGVMFNEAMFAGTGGFVLKPESHLPNPQTVKSLKELERTVDLKVAILAGQNLPLPDDETKAAGFKPYFKVTVHVSEEVKHKGKVDHNGKGQSIAWGERKGAIHLPKMTGVVQELSFVRFKLYDDEFGRDDKAGWACVRLNRLKQGYRFLKIFDLKGNETDGVLLIKVEKTVT